MSEYRRPAWPEEIYRNEQGQPIEYGQRWAGGVTPDDAYTRVTNPQRYEPLHSVAHALLDWLQTEFDVDVENAPGVVDDLLLRPTDTVHAVRIVPRNNAAAPLTLVLTPFPGVYLHAGLLHDFHFPVCGCDACDDDIAALAHELEWTVLTVVSGGYSERVALSGGIDYRLAEPGVATQSGHLNVDELPADRVAAARTGLPPDGQWMPWPRRTQAAPAD